MYWRSLAWATLAGVGLLALLVLRREEPPFALATPVASPAPPGHVVMAEPVYNPPLAAADHPAAPAPPHLRVLAPPHLARTVSASPVLYWWISDVPARSARCRLVLAAGDAAEPWFEGTLPTPTRSGLQSIALADLAAELPEGVPLRWSIELDSAVASAWIERVPASAELAAELARARPLDRASVYAAAGIWHEALAELEHAVHAAPDEATPQRHLYSLLASAGLDGAALQP